MRLFEPVTEPAMSSAASLPALLVFEATMVLKRLAAPPAALRPPPELAVVVVL